LTSKKEDESQVKIHSESTIQAFFDHAPKTISNLIISQIKEKEKGKKQKNILSILFKYTILFVCIVHSSWYLFLFQLLKLFTWTNIMIKTPRGVHGDGKRTFLTLNLANYFYM